MKPGDRLRFAAEEGARDLVVTSEPTIGTDGSVSFFAADAEAYEATERLRGLLEPHHAAARHRTAEEQAALAGSEPRVGRWVVGEGWVPVDGRGPYEGSTT